MIALIQRVNWAQVRIDENLHSEIGPGLLAFVGVERQDTIESADKLLEKLLSFRVFADDEGRMNINLVDAGGELMLVSQFTLAADTNQGLRPGFSTAMAPEEAQQMYNYLVDAASRKHGEKVVSGKFAADMQVTLENDGPVTFILKV